MNPYRFCKNPTIASLAEQNRAVRKLHKEIDTLKQELGDKLKAVKTYIFFEEADFKLSEGKPHEEIKADYYDFNELYGLLKGNQFLMANCYIQ